MDKPKRAVGFAGKSALSGVGLFPNPIKKTAPCGVLRLPGHPRLVRDLGVLFAVEGIGAVPA
ncbi:MAG: hypothetical protein DRP64_05940 [Verrucomicrobia bacterium]|nr:MAG: hypothetical protein DRP64_05940 [Verrucomicrobiota bacterium]